MAKTMVPVSNKPTLSNQEALRERVKELACLNFISTVIVSEDITPEDMIAKFISIIPQSWLYPEIAVAQIKVHDQTWQTGDIDACVSFQIAPLVSQQKEFGFIKVGYLQTKPDLDEGPFLQEERNLITAIAELLGSSIVRITHEQQIEREKQTLKAITDGIDDAIYVADPDSYELLHVNATTQKCWGDNIIGEKCYKALQNRDEPCPFCTNDKIFGEYLGKTYQWEFKNEINQHWYRCADKAIQWTNGKMVRFELANDITVQKETEIALRDTQKKLREKATELERSNKDLEQFAYVASHDLQEPLRMVASYTQLLEERYKNQLDEKADKYIQYAVEGAKRMQTLINDLLSFSRVGTRGKPLELVNSHQILENTLKTLQPLIQENDALIEAAALPIVCADASQLQQLFQNLISNAIKFRTETPPHITITSKQQGDMYEFSFKDNGIGIDPQYFEKIFIIFQRLHERGKYPGSGIGLSLVKKIVERHGGKIWIESQLNNGTTFHFTLKAAKETT